MSQMPTWFPAALAIARHQDQISAWPMWKRWLHRTFIAKHCPCCVEYKKWGAKS